GGEEGGNGTRERYGRTAGIAQDEGVVGRNLGVGIDGGEVDPVCVVIDIGECEQMLLGGVQAEVAHVGEWNGGIGAAVGGIEAGDSTGRTEGAVRIIVDRGKADEVVRRGNETLGPSAKRDGALDGL